MTCPSHQHRVMIRVFAIETGSPVSRTIHLTLPFGGTMKKSLLAGVALLGMSMFASFTYAADEKFTGILIDQACGKGKDETAAAKHPVSCSLKESCSKSGYELISG